MQTALMELLQWVRATLPMDLDTPRMIEDKIESLLPKEKQEIMNAYKQGQYDSEPIRETDAEQYFNETYGNNTKTK